MGGFGVLGFDNTGEAASSAIDYVQNTFNDVSKLATNNSGFSNTVTRNPLQNFYSNNDAPRYATKLLWIKDLTPISERGLWINNKPTFNIIFHENFPAANGYCFGNVLVNKINGGVRLDINGIGDGFGVGGVIRRVQWIVESVTGTGTAQQKLDGSNTTTINFGSGTTAWDGQPKYNLYTNASTNETRDIHDFRIEAVQTGTLQVTGVVVYYEIDGLQIDCFGGTTYLDKSPVVTVGTSLSIPVVNNFRGGRGGIYKTGLSAYGITTSLVTDVTSTAIGSSGTNILSLTTGHGSSFPPGTILYGVLASGATHYIGNVLTQSTDTLTMGVTLPIGISNTVYQILQTGVTYSISQTLMTKAFDFEPINPGPVVGSTASQSGVLAFQDPNLSYRVFGGSLSIVYGASLSSLLGQTYGIELSVASSKLQIDGKFQGLEFEFLSGASGYLQATFIVDGMAVFNLNEAVSSSNLSRKPILINAGPGWHSVQMLRGASHQQALVSKITGYNNKIFNGPSFGNLADLSFGQTFLLRDSQNASLMAIGNINRFYADSLNLSGNWIRGTTSNVGGGVYFEGASTNCTGRFSYYGTQVALVGNAASLSISIDGFPQTTANNQWYGSGFSNTFHDVSFSVLGSTNRIEAIDILQPTGEIKSTQNYIASGEEFVDNETIQQINGIISLKQNSISSNYLKTASVNITKQTKIFQTTAYGTSTAFFLGATSFFPIPGLAVTLPVTAGRPVFVNLFATGTVNTSPWFFSVENVGTGITTQPTYYLQIIRNYGGSSPVIFSIGQMGGVLLAPSRGLQLMPVSAINIFDTTPPIGINSWTFGMFSQSGTTQTIYSVQTGIQAMEL